MNDEGLFTLVLVIVVTVLSGTVFSCCGYNNAMADLYRTEHNIK